MQFRCRRSWVCSCRLSLYAVPSSVPSLLFMNWLSQSGSRYSLCAQFDRLVYIMAECLAKSTVELSGCVVGYWRTGSCRPKLPANVVIPFRLLSDLFAIWRLPNRVEEGHGKLFNACLSLFVMMHCDYLILHIISGYPTPNGT